MCKFKYQVKEKSINFGVIFAINIKFRLRGTEL
jgi:hypothetical protein